MGCIHVLLSVTFTFGHLVVFHIPVCHVAAVAHIVVACTWLTFISTQGHLLFDNGVCLACLSSCILPPYGGGCFSLRDVWEICFNRPMLCFYSFTIK